MVNGEDWREEFPILASTLSKYGVPEDGEPLDEQLENADDDDDEYDHN